MTELVVGEPLDEALVKQGEFLEMMQSRGEVAPDEEVLGDAIAFAGVSKYPARIKCALLGWMAFKDAAAQAMAAEDASKDTQKETA
jgi:nitrogen fixation NifU-like protein